MFFLLPLATECPMLSALWKFLTVCPAPPAASVHSASYRHARAKLLHNFFPLVNFRTDIRCFYFLYVTWGLQEKSKYETFKTDDHILGILFLFVAPSPFSLREHWFPGFCKKLFMPLNCFPRSKKYRVINSCIALPAHDQDRTAVITKRILHITPARVDQRHTASF